MRHNKAVNHLGRKSGHRKAMLANMASSLILKKRITTTEAKAKALKPYVEPLITKSKEDTTHSRRIVFSYLKDKEATAELFRTVAPKVADRPGGYLRILHTGFRSGDAAEMVLVEQVQIHHSAARSVLCFGHIIEERGPSAGQRQSHKVMRTRILRRVQTHQHIGLVLYVFGRESALGRQFLFVPFVGRVAPLGICR